MLGQPEAGVRCARLPAQLIDGSHLADFTVDKAGQHVRDFLRPWKGGWL